MGDMGVAGVKLPADVRLMPPREEEFECMLTEELEGPTLGLGFGAFSLREKTPMVMDGWLVERVEEGSSSRPRCGRQSYARGRPRECHYSSPEVMYETRDKKARQGWVWDDVKEKKMWKDSQVGR
jgi:hypothetical protein